MSLSKDATNNNKKSRHSHFQTKTGGSGVVLSNSIYGRTDSRSGKHPHIIKPYKWNRLFYTKYFRTLWNCTLEPKLTLRQHEYKMCTHMWLIRLNKDDINSLMCIWYYKHGIKANYRRLRTSIIPETYRYTRETVKAQKKAENERAKTRRLERRSAGGQS